MLTDEHDAADDEGEAAEAKVVPYKNKNKNKVLILSSRGVGYRIRHLMQDFIDLCPRSTHIVNCKRPSCDHVVCHSEDPLPIRCCATSLLSIPSNRCHWFNINTTSFHLTQPVQRRTHQTIRACSSGKDVPERVRAGRVLLTPLLTLVVVD